MSSDVSIALYASEKSTRPEARTLSWDDLRDLLQAPPTVTECDPCPAKNPDGSRYRCPAKSGRAWSPVVLDGPRKGENVREVTALVLDLDHVPLADLSGVIDRLSGLDWIGYSTHSHMMPRTEAALRAVVRLSRPVPAAEWNAFLSRAVARLQVPADPHCKDLSRIYFFASAPASRARYHMTPGDIGEALDVDAILAGTALSAPPPAQPVEPEDVKPQDPGVVSQALADLYRTHMRKGSTALAGILKAAIDGVELVGPGKGQANALHSLMSTLAMKLDTTIHVDTVIPVVHRSIVAMGAGPEGLEHWFDKARDSFLRGRARRIENDAARDRANEHLANALKQMGLGAARTPGDAPASDDENAERPAWLDQLILETNRAGVVRPMSCTHNANVIFRNDEAWVGKIRWNTLARTVEVAPDAPIAGPWSPSTLPNLVAAWFERNRGIFLSEDRIASSLAATARAHPYNPVLEYIDPLVWDGTARVETFLERAGNALLVDEDGHDITAHVRRISRMWLTSAAARAIEPGCQVDTVLVLEGGQGEGKTSLLRILGGPFYRASAIQLTNKDSQVMASSSWIIEVAELASFSKSENRDLKAFFTYTHDSFRPPYGKATEDFPRPCVYAATVNPEEDDGYLTDETGNRRYWPAVVRDIDLAWLRENRDQVWAEAAHLAREAMKARDTVGAESVPAHLRWWLNKEEQAVADAVAKKRVTTSPSSALVHDWLLGMEPKKRPEFVRTHEVAIEAMGIAKDRIDKRVIGQVAKALRELGFKRKKMRLHGAAPTWFYVAPEGLRELPQVTRKIANGAAVALVQGGKTA